MHLCFVSRAFAMNPNRREEVSIIFSAAVDGRLGSGRRSRMHWLRWIYGPSSPVGLLPLFSLPLKQHGLLLEAKLSKPGGCSVLEAPFVLTVISSEELRDKNLLQCVKPFCRSVRRPHAPAGEICSACTPRAVLSFSSSQRPLPPAVQTRARLPGHYWTSVPCLPLSYGKCEWWLRQKHIRRGNICGCDITQLALIFV